MIMAVQASMLINDDIYKKRQYIMKYIFKRRQETNFKSTLTHCFEKGKGSTLIEKKRLT